MHQLVNEPLRAPQTELAQFVYLGSPQARLLEQAFVYDTTTASTAVSSVEIQDGFPDGQEKR